MYLALIDIFVSAAGPALALSGLGLRIDGKGPSVPVERRSRRQSKSRMGPGQRGSAWCSYLPKIEKWPSRFPH